MIDHLFCLASNDSDFPTLAECRRRHGHTGHCCDTEKELAWDDHGEVDCEEGHDHGTPPNRAARRGTVTHENRAERRIRHKTTWSKK
jgi:hypothetical protein